MSSSLFFRHWLLSLDQLALDGVLDPPPAQQQNETIAGGVGCHPSPLLFVSPSYTSKTHRHTPYTILHQHTTKQYPGPMLYFVGAMRLLQGCCCWEPSGNKTIHFLPASQHNLPIPMALMELDGSSVDHWIMKTPEDHWEFLFGVVH